MSAVSATKRMIDSAVKFDEPDVRGEIISINRKLVGFAFRGEIRPSLAAFLGAKYDSNIPGLRYFQSYSFMSKLNQFELVNDSSNVDREGLAQLKNSLRPVGLHK